MFGGFWSRPRLTWSVNSLIGRCGEHQEFVPFVGQQSHVHLENDNIIIENVDLKFS